MKKVTLENEKEIFFIQLLNIPKKCHPLMKVHREMNSSNVQTCMKVMYKQRSLSTDSRK